MIEGIATGLGTQMAELSAADASAEEYLKSAGKEGSAAARSRLERAREPVTALRKEYEGLTTRLSVLPARLSWEFAHACDNIERDANGFRDRLDPCVAHLSAELAAYQQSLKPPAMPAREGEVHCLACGRAVPDAPFCQQCGIARPAVAACAECGNRIIIPVHLLAEERKVEGVFCRSCGARISIHP